MKTHKRTVLCQHCGGVNPLTATHCAYCSATLSEQLPSQDPDLLQGTSSSGEELGAFARQDEDKFPALDAGLLEASLYEAPPRFSSHPQSSRAWKVGEDPLSLQPALSEEKEPLFSSSIPQESPSLKISQEQSAPPLGASPPPSSPPHSDHLAAPKKRKQSEGEALKRLPTESFHQESAQKVTEKMIVSSRAPSSSHLDSSPSVEEDLFSSSAKIAVASSSLEKKPLGAEMSPDRSQASFATSRSLQESSLPPLSHALPSSLTEGENAELLARHQGVIFDESLLTGSGEQKGQEGKEQVERLSQASGSTQSKQSAQSAPSPASSWENPASALAPWEEEERPIYSVYDQPSPEKTGHLKKSPLVQEPQKSANSALSLSKRFELLQGALLIALQCAWGFLSTFFFKQPRAVQGNQEPRKSLLHFATSGLFGSSTKMDQEGRAVSYRSNVIFGLTFFGQVTLLWSLALIFFSKGGTLTLTWSSQTWPLFFILGALSLWLSLRFADFEDELSAK